MRVLPGFYHEVFHERDKSVPIGHAARFIGRAYARDMIETPGERTDPVGSEDYEVLRRPLPLYSPRRWAYGVARLAMKTLGRLSEGIRVIGSEKSALIRAVPFP